MNRMMADRTLFCICLLAVPIFLAFAAPTPEDSLKQQISSSGIFRTNHAEDNNNNGYWMGPAMAPGYQEQLRRLESANVYPFGGHFGPYVSNGAGGFRMEKKSPFDSLSGSTFGTQKRNFDEIDRVGLGFTKKNFDEIDRSGGFGSFVKKNFDEIDRSGGFGSFVKRA